jgi:Uma2 family endonuclease
MAANPQQQYRVWYDVEIRNGDHMTQAEFHSLYQRTPEGYRAELIDGTVFVCEPLGIEHGEYDVRLSSVLDAYGAGTPGVQVCGNATVILGEKDEVQPDLLMRILPEFGGRSRDKGGKPRCIQGAPELAIEIAYSSRAMDLHVKRRRYERAGVIEYIVLCLEPLQLYWFDLRNQCDISADADGIFRSGVFPGLWISAAALLSMEYQPLMDVLRRGLESPEHVAFVDRLRG